MKVSVVLPTFDERENIVPLIEELQQQISSWAEPELIVVDDNSPDGTANVVQEKFAEDSRVRIFVRTRERGLATAIKFGLVQATGDVIVVMDTDFNHDPRMIPQMVKFLEYYDMIIGSRFVMRGGMEDTRRYLLSFVFNFGLRLVLRTQIQDNLCGFFSIRRDKLLSLDLDKILRGYGEYFIRLVLVAWRNDFKLLEVPVFYQLRKHGSSKTGFLRVLRDYTIAAIRLRVQIWNNEL